MKEMNKTEGFSSYDIKALEEKEKIMKHNKGIIKWSTLGSIVLIFVIMGGMFGCPRYKVWEQEMSGKAEFAKAEQNRKIKVLEATANLESQKLNAQSEVERAKGVAQANAIISDGLKGNEEYLRYLWIRGLEDNKNSQVIYVPTEANLPILEAGKRPQ